MAGRDFGTTGRQLGDQVARPAGNPLTPEAARNLAEIRKRLQALQEDLQILTGERGGDGRPKAAVRREDLAGYVSGQPARPIADPTGTAGGTYSATEQAMLNDMKATITEMLAALRAFGIIQK